MEISMKFLGLFIIVVCIISAAGKKHARKQRDVNDAFWDRETAANYVRKKDISNLPYIIIPLEKFPIGIEKNDELLEYESALKQLSEKKILNLSSQTNTDLKLAYGPANLPALSEYDQNFATLCTTLSAYGERLLALGHEDEARAVLEYGVEIGSDISKTYLTLAGIYQKHGLTTELAHLKECAEKLDSIMKRTILTRLAEIS